MNLFDLSGKVAIITGSSRGIGQAIAEAYADAGAHVVISSRKQPACDQIAAAINDKHGEERAVAITASISEKAELENLVAQTRARFGHIDLLVCNADTNPYLGPMAGITDEQFQKIFDNNILANHWLVSMVSPEMIERKDGAIIVISSIGGLIGSTVLGAYNMSKAADLQLVRNLAVELGPHNIRVNAIAPGIIRTRFARALWEDAEAEARWQQIAPLGRLGEPEEIAGGAVFLASKAGAYITGQTIIIDGGTTIRHVG
jgi:NAD(P)-dependent dehydrogenase (short-subunit alcohol dehydrogenase family)